MNNTSPLHYKEQADETLVALTLMRDEAAFEELVIRHRKAALLVAKTVTRNIHTAEDAVQDAFLCAWQRLDTLKDAAKFGAWVCRIAKYRAINLARRYKDYIPFDEVENYLSEQSEDITGYYNDQAETELLRECVEKLSEKIGTVIRLFYFEGLSISDIALKMSLAEGTVKSRLSAGRHAIRKELGYMDQNNENETLVEAVMRRVEEFKAWRLKNSKVGFEEDYKDVLSRVEELPDSEKKFYAMADVLRLGYWYLPDGQTDEMRARLKEAAVKGGNKGVLAMCIGFGADKYSGWAKAEYLYNVIIPELEAYGIPEEACDYHYWMGVEFMDMGEMENARKEFTLALEKSTHDPLEAALAKSTLTTLEGLGELVEDRSRYRLHSTSEELVKKGGKLYYSKQPGFSRGTMNLPRQVHFANAPLYYASRADSVIFDEGMKVGDRITDSEGKYVTTYVSDEAVVETACGTFYDCMEMESRFPASEYVPAPIFVAWYKPNIGLVAFAWRKEGGETFDKTSLSSYTVIGGHGFLPLAVGNTWCYAIEGIEDDLTYTVEVTATTENQAYLSYVFYVKGKPFDKNCWLDQLLYARNNYYTPMSEVALDVSTYHDRAMALAVTPWEKKVTELSRSIMNRIYRGELKSHPDAKQEGRWNFFCYYDTNRENGKITIEDNRTYAFEWKNMNPECWSMLFNFIYDTLQSNLGAIWDDAWLDWVDKDEEFEHHRPVLFGNGQEFVGYAKIKSGVTVETTAGRFENCLNFRTRTSQNEAPGLA